MSFSNHILHLGEILRWNAPEMRECLRNGKTTWREMEAWDSVLPFVLTSCMLSSSQQWDVTKSYFQGHFQDRYHLMAAIASMQAPKHPSVNNIANLFIPLSSPEFHWEYVSFCFVKLRQRNRFLVVILYLQVSFMKNWIVKLTAHVTPLIWREMLVCMCVCVCVCVCMCVSSPNMSPFICSQ